MKSRAFYTVETLGTDTSLIRTVVSYMIGVKVAEHSEA